MHQKGVSTYHVPSHSIRLMCSIHVQQFDCTSKRSIPNVNIFRSVKVATTQSLYHCIMYLAYDLPDLPDGEPNDGRLERSGLGLTISVASSPAVINADQPFSSLSITKLQ